jgi:hypothetical protein
MVDHEDELSHIHSIVYDVKYRGRVHGVCPEAFKSKYCKSKWMSADMIIEQAILSRPTMALVEAMKIDASLK